VDSIFRVAWSDLTLPDVAAFFETAGDEGLTWEAKGTERPHPDSVRKQVSAFGNSIGGYLIIGAVRRQDGGWAIPGVAFPDEEPQAWVSHVIRENGVRPVPKFDVKSWATEEGSVAVVQVEPVAAPPCITRSGEVFERVSGESPRVTDPIVLARLFERGSGAEKRAEGAALRQADYAALADPGEPPFLIVGVSVARIGQPDDIGRRVFSERFAESQRETVRGLPREPLFFFAGEATYRNAVTQDSVIATMSNGGRHRWEARVSWDGSVLVLYTASPGEDFEARSGIAEVVRHVVSPGARAAVGLADHLDGYGRAHVVVRAYGRGFTFITPEGRGFESRGPEGMRPIQRWTGDDGVITDAVLASIQREWMRAGGVEVWEPE
jgi:hypothetical protein